MRTWKGVRRKGSVNAAPKRIPRAGTLGPPSHSAHLRPRRSTITSTTRFARFSLQREREKAIMATPSLNPILGKSGRAQVYWGLLKGGFGLGDQI